MWHCMLPEYDSGYTLCLAYIYIHIRSHFCSIISIVMEKRTLEADSLMSLDGSDAKAAKKFAKGDLVEVHTLVGKKEHNGCTGILCEFNEEKGRWAVKVNVGVTARRNISTMFLKPDNLKQMMPPMLDRPGGELLGPRPSGGGYFGAQASGSGLLGTNTGGGLFGGANTGHRLLTASTSGGCLFGAKAGGAGFGGANAGGRLCSAPATGGGLFGEGNIGDEGKEGWKGSSGGDEGKEGSKEGKGDDTKEGGKDSKVVGDEGKEGSIEPHTEPSSSRRVLMSDLDMHLCESCEYRWVSIEARHFPECWQCFDEH